MVTLQEPKLSQRDFKSFQHLILELAGIALADSKEIMVQSRLAKRLRRHEKELFTFVEVQGVPFDNNHAERMIRPAVIIRKNSYGNGSKAGADMQTVLMSVYQTLKQRGHNPLNTIIEAIQVYLANGTFPPLPGKITEIG